jgi:hypothetical protein
MKTNIGVWFHKPEGFEAIEIKTIATILLVFAAAGVATAVMMFFMKMQLGNVS